MLRTEWKKIECKSIHPPFVPQLKGPTDTSYFEKFESCSVVRLPKQIRTTAHFLGDFTYAKINKAFEDF